MERQTHTEGSFPYVLPCFADHKIEVIQFNLDLHNYKILTKGNHSIRYS